MMCDVCVMCVWCVGGEAGSKARSSGSHIRNMKFFDVIYLNDVNSVIFI